MIGLVAVGVVAGFLAGISPCILPVLPVILVAGFTRSGATDRAQRSQPTAAAAAQAKTATQPKAQAAGAQSSATKTATKPAAATAGQGQGQGQDAPPRSGLARPLAVIGGLVLSFSLLILAGSEIISLLHLPSPPPPPPPPPLLALVGLGYLIPPLGALLERPFSRIATRKPTGRAGGFVLGLALGVLYVPCAGPVLAAITVVGATHRVGLTAVFVTAAFAVGTAIPLLAVAIAGSELAGRVGALKRRAPLLRQVGGIVLIVMAVAIAFNAFDGLQKDIPSYSTALQGSQKVRKELGALSGAKPTSLTKCSSTATTLVNCGKAPNFAGITNWLNTPGGKPLSIHSLRGKVVLVDFWTYSCINCQRTLPHVESWYKEYAKYGLVVVGVHTPEFAFEHVVSNIKAESSSLGVHYPVAVDNGYETWNAYSNEYWPADYLVDAQGNIRHIHFGEGDYPGTEQFIRQLLVAAHPGLKLPAAIEVADKTPTGEMSPETYVGYERLQYLVPQGSETRDAPAVYHFPSSLPLGGMAWNGTWTDHLQEATAGKNAQLELSFLAKNIYLVLGGNGTLDVTVNGHQIQTLKISGTPRLYTLYQAGSSVQGKLVLHASPGVQAYDFTFG
jgi:cytochrome c biogenesis protein CcdA/thiol-disulfide isomerase/thioredoxin